MDLLLFVGVRRLELPTPCTPCKYASQLRHTPKTFANVESFLVWSKCHRFSF